RDVSISVSPDPHLSRGAVSYFDAIGGVYVDLSTQLGKRGGVGASWLGGPASVTPLAIDTLSGVHNATGSGFHDFVVAGTAGGILSGLAGSDTLTGGAGSDRLDGGAGIDQMAGGGGNDLYYVDNAGDQVTEAGGGGRDIIYASADYTLAPGTEVEYLRAGGTAGRGPSGNDPGNYLIRYAGGPAGDGRAS